MTTYIQYQTNIGGVVLVEVEGEELNPAQGIERAGRLGDKIQSTVKEVQIKFDDAMDTVHQNAQTIIRKVSTLSDPPDQVEVTFGLKTIGELGNFAVAKTGAEANYTIKLTWKRNHEQEVQ